MPRFINPVPGYAYPTSGKLYFYKAGTNEDLNTFADELETIPNSNPVLLGPLGRAPNIWFTANARVVLQDANSQQVWEKDPVGGQGAFTPFADWVSTISYDVDDIAKLNGTFYISKTGANQGNSPALSSGSNANWGTVNFLNLYDSTYTYASGDIVNTSSGQIWASQAASNLNNNPSDDDGTKWLPAVNGAKIPEVAANTLAVAVNTLSITTDIPNTGGGLLIALRDNELQDAGAYTLPLANSVSANQWIGLLLPSTFSAFEPTVTRTGSDLLRSGTGTSTVINFDGNVRVYFKLYSNGVDEWRT